MIPRDRLIVIHGRDRRRMAAEALSRLEAERFLPPGGTIGLKPNLVVPKPSSSGATTDPELAAGVLSYLRDHGWREFVIMEGSWVGADTREAFRVCGYEELAGEFGARLVDLKRDCVDRVEARGLKMEVCRSARVVDALIDLPVLKAHCQTKLTCALKNLKGCIPDREKRRFHQLGLDRPIACLSTVLPVALTVVDGVEGDLTFEEGGNPVRMDMIMAGYDPVLVDAHAAEILGYAPSEIGHIRMASEFGTGSMDTAKAVSIELGAKEPPPEVEKRGRLTEKLSRRVEARAACSACYGPLLHALARMADEDPGRSIIRVGQGFRGQTGRGPGIGNCTRGLFPFLPGCPPSTLDMIRFLRTINGDLAGQTQ